MALVYEPPPIPPLAAAASPLYEALLLVSELDARSDDISRWRGATTIPSTPLTRLIPLQRGMYLVSILLLRLFLIYLFFA